MKQVIGIKLCNPERHVSQHVYRVTYDGNILGDSRGYDRARAIQEAIATVERDPDNRDLEPMLKMYRGH